ncbi:MAG: hypothetical protein FWG10_10485 [Eubacteriaceae bacterium]|nr:hypothetical protein [Eubacteriaceae bacterium]
MYILAIIKPQETLGLGSRNTCHFNERRLDQSLGYRAPIAVYNDRWQAGMTGCLCQPVIPAHCIALVFHFLSITIEQGYI